MNWFKTKFPFFLIVLIGFCVLFLLIYNVIYDWNMTNFFLSLLIVFILVALFLLFLRNLMVLGFEKSVEEFAKTLHGGLFHFKCPRCNGVFAIKKSKKNNKKAVKMKCPHCGRIGVIPGKSSMILEEEIPEKKSLATNFKCINCGEGLTVWAEGGSLYHDVDVITCPYCGMERTLKKI